MKAKIFLNLWMLFYRHPSRGLDELAELDNPTYGSFFALARGIMLATLFYLPFFLLGFEPITPAYLPILDTPHYFLYATLFWPLFAVLSWMYLQGIVYAILRLLGYRADWMRVFNLGGWIDLGIGCALIVFDWSLVALNLHNDPVILGIAHILIADPWSIALSVKFYKKKYKVPVFVSILLGILVRVLYFPLAILFIRT